MRISYIILRASSVVAMSGSLQSIKLHMIPINKLQQMISWITFIICIKKISSPVNFDDIKRVSAEKLRFVWYWGLQEHHPGGFGCIDGQCVLYKRFKSYIMHAACFRPPVEILTFNIFLVEYVFLIHYTLKTKTVKVRSGMIMFYSMFWDVLQSILSFSEESEMISNASFFSDPESNQCLCALLWLQRSKSYF